MALRASATARPPISSPPRTSSPTKTTQKPQIFKPKSISVSTANTLSLIALFTAPLDATALTLSKEQIVSSITQVSNFT